MMRSYEAEIDESGRVQLLEAVHLRGPCRAVVTVLENTSEDDSNDALLKLAESTLSQDWDRPEEDEAWAHLQLDR
ncbi:MAG: hypothetical protein HQL52_13535 [Magnetococcales bacterium]|nr:hypothetical protein [Magnetococcales bacterium]